MFASTVQTFDHNSRELGQRFGAPNLILDLPDADSRNARVAYRKVAIGFSLLQLEL